MSTAPHQVEVLASDGTSKGDLTLVKLERSRKYNQMDSARVWVPSPEAESLSLEEDSDEIIVTDDDNNKRWAGILTEARRRADRFEFVSDGFERLARDAEPSAGLKQYTGTTDQTVVQDAVDAVSDLSRGTIEETETGFDIDFYFATPALKIRQMRLNATGTTYPVYNFDKSVDYVSSIGSDKTGTLLSPSIQNVKDFRVEQSNPDPTPTHIRAIGNNGEYVDVTASSYSGGREIWRRAYFNDISSTTVLQNTAENLIAELEVDDTRIELTVIGDPTYNTGLTPKLGDQYHIEYSDYDVDRNASISSITEVFDSSGTHYECVFSERDVSFERDEEFETQSRLKRRFDKTSTTDSGQYVPIPNTELLDGEFISYRIFVPSGSTLNVYVAGVQNDSNSAPTNLTAEVDDETNSTNLVSINSKRSTGSPLATVDGAVDVAFRIENDTGSKEVASGHFRYEVV